MECIDSLRGHRAYTLANRYAAIVSAPGLYDSIVVQNFFGRHMYMLVYYLLHVLPIGFPAMGLEQITTLVDKRLFAPDLRCTSH